ncbi:MAG: hypothetical protein R3D80_13330 [Paracoccaceae bacterium]
MIQAQTIFINDARCTSWRFSDFCNVALVSSLITAASLHLSRPGQDPGLVVGCALRNSINAFRPPGRSVLRRWWHVLDDPAGGGFSRTRAGSRREHRAERDMVGELIGSLSLAGDDHMVIRGMAMHRALTG